MGSSQLRTRLRNLNAEYSTLVRDRSADNRDLRLATLRRQRENLMSLLASNGTLRVIEAPKADDFSGCIDITLLLPRANNGMSA